MELLAIYMPCPRRILTAVLLPFLFADIQTQGMQIGDRPASHHITNTDALNTLQNTVSPGPKKGPRRNAANS
jgi:hypothetical protein